MSQTEISASHRSVALLALLAASSRGLSHSRGNLNDVGAICFALVLLGLLPTLLRGHRWTGSSDTVGGFSTWQVGLPLLFVYTFSTNADRHLLVFSAQDWRPTLTMITSAGLALALPVLLLSARTWRDRLSANVQVAFYLLPMVPILVVFCLVTTTSPSPVIDVFSFQTGAADMLLRGINPYQVVYQNPYSDGSLYPSGQPDSFPYPPMAFLSAVIGYLLGDVRWPLIACHVATAVLLWATARERKLPATEAVGLAGLFLCMPQGPFLSEQAWTDPSVTLGLALMSLMLARRRADLALWAAGLALALKQTMIVLPPLLWGLWRRIPTRGLVALFCLSAVSYGLFLMWDADALFNDVVRFHMLTPFRPLSLTLSGYLVYFHEVGPLPGWASLIGVVVGVGASLRALGSDAGAKDSPCDSHRVWRMYAGLSFTFLLTLALSKHAFMNYYYLVHFSLLTALIWSRIADREAVDIGAARS